MIGFIAFDLIFLVAFTLAVVLFLYTRRHNLTRQGLLYLYRTRVGIKFIDWFAARFKAILKPLQYVIVASGYFLMAFMVWFLAKFSYSYLTSPVIAKALKVPVLLPLIPYLPSLFKIDFLPPFYFTYWIIIIAIIAIPHEFAHGIFARLNKVKVHSTGFGFLGPFLAAFVEPDEKEMEKMKKFPQLAILASGTFANVLVTIFSAIVLWLFFIASFTAAGVNFNTYSTSVVNTSDISFVSDQFLDGLELVPITVSGVTYYANQEVVQRSIDSNLEFVIAYDDSPAFNAQLSGSITEVSGIKVTSQQELSAAIFSYEPGDNVIIKTIDDGEVSEYDIQFSERNGKAFLGIGTAVPRTSGIIGKFYTIATNIKDPTVYYESNTGNFGVFIYDLIWWTVIISLSVALVNMIPVGIFDGGRFFFLTIWGITGSRKAGEKAFAISTWLVLLLVAALMAKWFFVFFF